MSLEDEIKKLNENIGLLIKILKDHKKNTETNRPRIIPVTQWNKYHSWPPIGGLRSLIFNAKSNGIGQCIKKVGKSVLIIEDEFLNWLKNHPGVK